MVGVLLNIHCDLYSFFMSDDSKMSPDSHVGDSLKDVLVFLLISSVNKTVAYLRK